VFVESWGTIYRVMGRIYPWASHEAVDALELWELGEYLRPPPETPDSGEIALPSGPDGDGSDALAMFAGRFPGVFIGGRGGPADEQSGE
jgi:hypothetical protein